MDTNNNNTVKEKCVICLEKTDFELIFSVNLCSHRYCFSCMKKHVQLKLLDGTVPKCPHQECNSELSLESCSKFLSSELTETMRERIKEASIPVTERVYCPYPHCSTLMSKNEIVAAGSEECACKCSECDILFCVNCKVPWHNDMTCYVYKGLNPNPPAEDVKLKCLAATKQWRQCVKCGHMIELAQGCFHITCRCGFEFCYNCGAEFRGKKATCSCPLWDEANIWNEQNRQ